MKKIKTSTALIIVLATAVIIGGGTLTWAFGWGLPDIDFGIQSPITVTKKTNTNTNKNSNTNQNTNTNSATADWKTYTNTDYGFSFKYPKDWYVENYTFDNRDGFQISNYQNSDKYDKSNTPSGLIRFYALPGGTVPAQETIIKQETINSMTIYYLRSLSDMTTENQAQVLASTEVYAKEASFTTAGQKFLLSMISLEDKTKMQNQIKYFDLIIPTFKFTK